MIKPPRELTAEEARAIMAAASDALCEKLVAVANDEDDATKMDRAAAIIAKATPEVSAIVVLSILASLREYEERLAVYEHLLGKVGQRTPDTFDA
jgi:hypothetical protein